MYKFDNELLKSEERSVFFSLCMFLGFIALGFVAGSFVGFLLAIPFFEGGLEEMQQIFQSSPEIIKDHSLAFLIMQGGMASMFFIVFPLLYIYFIEHKKWEDFFAEKQSFYLPQLVILTLALTIVVMPITSTLMEWNQHMVFPEFLKGLEQWFQAKEEQAAVMTKAITTFHSFKELMIGIIVIAGVAAVGEELVFRGILQNLLWKGTNNIHLSIWITGFIFSAIHLQFYGLIPRMMLGVLFGYCYFWSKNLWLPILAHFVNNAVTVLLLHFSTTGALDIDIEKEGQISWQWVLLSVVLSTIILYYYRQKAFSVEKNEQ